MAIIVWPNDIETPSGVACSICGSLQAVKKVSAGMEDLSGRQAFCCDVHIDVAPTYIVGWMEFAAVLHGEPYDDARLLRAFAEDN
jgi:hypothetical protein